MDGQRFDEMTRVFATGASRRTVLRAALGGMGAGVLVLIGGADAGATGKRSCVADCKRRFGPGRARGQCISTCARGTGKSPSTGPVSCGPNVCESGEYCCNESCGICAPIGGACTQEFCGPT